MSTLHQNPPSVKAPITAAEWAAYRASRSARPAPVAWQVGDRVLYHTPRNGSGAGRNIRGVVVKVNAKTVTIEYAMLNRMTQEIVGYKRLAVNPMRLARVIEPVADDVNWHGGGKGSASLPAAAEVSAEVNWNSGPQMGGWQARGNGPQAEEMPWEVLLDEIEYKPNLGWPWGDDGDQTDEDQGSTDDDPEPTETEEGGDDDGRSNDELDASLDFDYLLTQLRQRGGCPCPRGRIDPVMQDIEDGRFELAFVTGNSWI